MPSAPRPGVPNIQAMHEFAQTYQCRGGIKSKLASSVSKVTLVLRG